MHLSIRINTSKTLKNETNMLYDSFRVRNRHFDCKNPADVCWCEKYSCENKDDEPLTVHMQHQQHPGPQRGPESGTPPDLYSAESEKLGAELLLSLVRCYLICGFGGGGFGVGAEWAPGQGKGADSALHPLRSCSSSCLPDWRAVDQPESSSLNTNQTRVSYQGLFTHTGSNQFNWNVIFIFVSGRKVKKVRA